MSSKIKQGYIFGLIALIAGYFIGSLAGYGMDWVGQEIMNTFADGIETPTRGSIILTAAIACAAAFAVHWNVCAREKTFKHGLIFAAIVLALAIAMTIWQLSATGTIAWWYLLVSAVAATIYVLITKKYDPEKDRLMAEKRAREREKQEREALLGTDEQRAKEKAEEEQEKTEQASAEE